VYSFYISNVAYFFERKKMEYQTKGGYVISEENYNKIKELCPQLSFDEIMRLIDLFKSGAVNI
jgi:hypothetical protein